MKFKTKLLVANCVPFVLFALVALLIGLVQFRSSLYTEKEGNLRSTALAALTLYSSQGYGDYSYNNDGCVWRGMNQNISRKTSIVDDLKRQTKLDVTFYYGETAAMTSIRDDTGMRMIGMSADENIRTYILEQGKQLWFKSILIDGKEHQAYVIPIRQESDDSVVGALMVSQSAQGFDNIIRNYILTMMGSVCIILVLVLSFIRANVDWFMQKYTEVSDKSRHDLLTGLLNKLTFENESKEYLHQRDDEDKAILLILDFDNFKHVNDNYGHQIGDAVLKAFANILTREFRPQDLIGRVGGDEFMVLMRGIKEKDVGRADEISSEILDQLSKLHIGNAGPFSCSIGIGTDSTGYDFDGLYKLADKALYEAKERGKACYVRYDSTDTI